MGARSWKALVVAVAAIGAAVIWTTTPASAATAVLERVAPGFAIYPAAPLAFSPAGDVTAIGQFVDVQIPPAAINNTSTSGCEAADFAGFVPGRIAIIQRGTCTFAVKALNAQVAGASAVVIFNEGQPGRTDVFPASLGGPGVTIPVVSTSFATAQELYLIGAPVTLHVKTTLSGLETCAAPPASGTPVAGKNVIVAQPGAATSGTEGADVIYGTTGADQISGLGGDDLIYGFGGNDLISGGAGEDTICGGDGHDALLGGDGNDLLSGGAGNDSLAGNAGNDGLFDSSGWNRLDGGADSDFCSASGSNPSQTVSCELVEGP